MSKHLIGIIGGSGLYAMEGLEIKEEKKIETPFGAPSDAVMLGTMQGQQIAFLARHARGHLIPPHQINFRANIYALKTLGVDSIISVSAVGSMKEDIHPGDIVIVDQFVDRTKVRHQTFFEDGIVAHVSFADPVCKCLADKLIKSAKNIGANVHEKGTYICIEGPMFSSRAESHIYRSWGVDVIGMTNYQEAKLAKEAEICYATIALSTDYDCWRVGEEAVDVAQVIEVMHKNVETAQKIIKDVLSSLSTTKTCNCNNCLQNSIMTAPDKISKATKKRLKPIIDKYIK
ncbi:MAG: S-methyl-5'-thioadenosine phosphorylase [Pseudomonadota bacterium]